MTREVSNPHFYDADSARYDVRWETAGGAQTNRAQQEIVHRLCAGWRSGRVVEIGPGTGRFSIPMARKGNRLTLVDLSSRMLEQARRNLKAAELDGQVEAYVHGSIYGLPFADESFDHALALNVFNHLERADAALEEMARVVRPGATLLFNYANLQSYFWPVARRINRRRHAVGHEVSSVWETPRAIAAMIDRAELDLIVRIGNVHAPRAVERYHLQAIFGVLDRISRSGALHRLAPIHYCLCRKR